MLQPPERISAPSPLHVASVLLVIGVFLILTLVFLLYALSGQQARAGKLPSGPQLRFGFSLRHAPPSTADNWVQAIASWVTETGQKAWIRGPIAAALGLPETDVAVRERGFRVIGDRLTHVVSMSGQLQALFFASTDEDSGDAIVWRVGSDGEVAATAVFRDGVAVKAGKASYTRQFLAETDFILAKLAASQIPSGPKTTPSPLPAEPTLVRASVMGGSNSELGALFASGWVLPAILCILATGVHRPRQQRERERF